MKRICGDCTACCEGWFKPNIGEGWFERESPNHPPQPAEIYGHQIKPGLGCHFKSSHCTIYENRPNHPCKTYECAWLKNKNNSIPEWLKPNISKVIITERQREQPSGTPIVFWDVTECGEQIISSHLNWILIFCEKNDIPVKYRIDGIEYRKFPSSYHEKIRRGEMNIEWGEYW